MARGTLQQLVVSVIPGCAEYRDGSSVFRDKIHGLEQQYTSIRRTRGDGNCAFRAFIFGYMEQLVNTNDLQERNRSALHFSLGPAGTLCLRFSTHICGHDWSPL